MTLLEQWRGSAYNENMTQEQYNQFWNHYFVIEKGFYESLHCRPGTGCERRAG